MRNILTTFLKYFLVAVILIIFLSPIVWTFLSAFKSRTDLFAYPPKFIFKPSFSAFAELLDPSSGFIQCLTNTLVIAASTTVIAVFVGSLMAYSIARFRYRGRKIISMQAILLTTIPGIVLIIPLFYIVNGLRLLDTIPGLILAQLSWTLPFAIWVMRGFFEELPKEVEESALIDGCTRLRTFLHITLPLALPGLIAAGVIIFLAVWNEFMFSNILTRTVAKTLTVYIAGFVTPVDTIWEKIFAAQVIAELPVILLTIAIYKYMVRGLTFGAVKG
ncbi:MAG: carbohydrate ABC transporter permease [Candidatus Bathyarchaeia archaeon]